MTTPPENIVGTIEGLLGVAPRTRPTANTLLGDPGLAALLSPAANIAGVLTRLDALVQKLSDAGSRLGYFAALYRRVTQGVQEGIAAGQFDDGPRMDRFDTDFANRYFAALSAYIRGLPAPGSWTVAFTAADDPTYIIVQHLLLGINAHINYDLGAAAASVCRDVPLESLHDDFNRINTLLAGLTSTVEKCLDGVSPMISALDTVCGPANDRLAIFSLDVARDDAWRLAEMLSAAPPSLRPAVARLADDKAAFLGRLVAHPLPPVRDALAVVRGAEVGDVHAVMGVLTRP